MEMSRVQVSGRGCDTVSAARSSDDVSSQGHCMDQSQRHLCPRGCHSAFSSRTNLNTIYIGGWLDRRLTI